MLSFLAGQPCPVGNCRTFCSGCVIRPSPALAGAWLSESLLGSMQGSNQSSEVPSTGRTRVPPRLTQSGNHSAAATRAEVRVPVFPPCCLGACFERINIKSFLKKSPVATLLVHEGVRAPDGQPESPALHPPPGPGRPPVNQSGREVCRHLRQLRSLGAHGLSPAVGLGLIPGPSPGGGDTHKGPILFWLEIQEEEVSSSAQVWPPPTPCWEKLGSRVHLEWVPHERGSLSLQGLQEQQLSHQGSHQPRGWEVGEAAGPSTLASPGDEQ